MSEVRYRDINFNIKMMAKRVFTFLTFVALCDNNIIFGAMAANGVSQMNELLQYSGWPDLIPLEAFTKGDWCNVERLLMTDAKERNLVTYRNIDEKVQQAHKILNCDYAIMFLTYIVYLKSIGRKLYSMIDKNIGTDEEKQECLVKFRQLSDGKVLVLRMQSAIGYLESMSPKTDLTKDFSGILKKFGCVNEMIPNRCWEQRASPRGVTKRFSSLCGSIHVIDEDNSKPAISKTLKFIEDLEKLTENFFHKQCRPQSHLSKSENIGRSTYGWSLMLTDEYFQDDSSYIDKMHTNINKIINDFIVLDYTHLGFAFNAESCTTVLIENSDKENRVQQTNEILTHICSSIQSIECQYSMEDMMATDQEYKMRLIYGFMNCYFVRLLKDLLFYKKSIVQLFFGVDHAAIFEFFISSVKIIKKTDPVILRMRDTLWYFRRLSPQTRFEKDILKIIYFLMNSIEMINLYQSKDYDTLEVDQNRDQMLCEIMRSFQCKLTDIGKELNEYTMSFCVIPAVTATNSEDPLNSQMEIEKQVDEIIKSILETELLTVGFDTTRFQGLL